MATPYDGKVAIWHWKGDSVPQNTIDEVALNLKSNASHVTQLWVKTSDGASWQGRFDTDRNLAVDGPASVDRWVQGLQRHNLEFHAWSVPKGRSADWQAEADIIIQACLRPGVRSMILDVEPYAGFWEGGRAGVRPFMTRIRRAIPGSFHIGIAVDPRSQHFNTIFPMEWFPFVNSVHLMVYWATFRRTPADSLTEAYRVWGNYGRPLIPILQGNATVGEMNTARTTAINTHRAPGISWWRLGVVGPVEWPAINQPMVPGTTPPPVTPPGGTYGAELVVDPNDAGFASGSYTGANELQTFQGTWGWPVFFKATESQTSKVWAKWSPRLPAFGFYEISTFVPARHATTKNARFKIHGVKGSNHEIEVSVDQSRYSNQWIPLGVFEFDTSTINAATVFLNDLTSEAGLEIAFDAVRWRQVVTGSNPVQPGVSDGYDSPIGTESERRSAQVWPGNWFDATGFKTRYRIGTPQEAFHTGADLNLNKPYFDADAHSPVYASASGVVTFAGSLSGWGPVIVIRHDPLRISTGQVLYGRYAHVEQIRVRVGQRVSRGEQIANVGNASGMYPFHLHFDLSPTNILETQPQHWPKLNMASLDQNYIDPRTFVGANRPR